MRFLIDENVSRMVTTRLEVAGFDVRPLTSDQRGSSDAVVLALAEQQGRIVMTEDRDFGELVIRQRLPVAGLVLLELDRLSNAAEAERVLSVVSTLAEGLIGNLVVIEPSRTRVRHLPDRT